MWALFVGLTFGLLASARSDAIEVKSRGCSYVGVFHVEGNDRYKLSYDDANSLCQKLGATLATQEQVNTAYDNKMETCRYGWTANQSIVILRHTPHEKCYLNETGFGVKQGNSSMLSDAYCYNETDSSLEKNCENAINPVSTKSDGETVATSEETTDSPAEATAEVATGSDELLSVTSVTITEAPEEPDETPAGINDTVNIEHPTSIIDLSTDEVFTLTPEAPGEDQRTGTTDITSVLLPDDTTGSGIMPTAEETTGTAAPEAPEPQPEQPEPQPEEPELKPETKLDSNTAPNPAGRKVAESGAAEEQKKKGSDWLVILLVIVAIAAIVLLIAAVVTRKRWCGKHQTLNISKSGGEGNGAAATVVGSRAEEREQEMVTLMNKEKIQENGNAEEFTAISVEDSSEKA